MPEPKDGGPAFPRKYFEYPDDGEPIECCTPGLSLRDYFAAAALPAILGSPRWAAHPEVSLNDATHAAALASYALADALLKAREGRS